MNIDPRVLARLEKMTSGSNMVRRPDGSVIQCSCVGGCGGNCGAGCGTMCTFGCGNNAMH